MSKIIATADGSQTIWDERTGATYHSINGAVQESMWVFIQTGLHFLTNAKKKIKILEVGFGTGLNAFLTAYKKSPLTDIEYTGIELYPLPTEIISQLKYTQNAEENDFFSRLHKLSSGETQKLRPDFQFTVLHTSFEKFESDSKFDLIYFDAFSPQEQPELWSAELMMKCANLLNTGGILVTYCAQGQFKRNLKAAGFEVQELPGPPGKRQITRAIKK